MNPYLDYDGTDDRLETNIAPGSYDKGYLCGGWTLMEAIGSYNAMFGSTNSIGVRGVRFGIQAAGGVNIARGNGISLASINTSTITQLIPFIGSAEYSIDRHEVSLNSGTAVADESDNIFNGSTQVALLGMSNNAESGVTAAVPIQGSMFSQIWLPTIPTDEQQAILRAYCASKAGVTL